jgi:hypothetical protein
MSIFSIDDIQKQGWGLEDEDLGKIIKIEKLKEVSHEFHDQIETLVKGFNSKSNIRIIAFNDRSGIDLSSKSFFSSFISSEKHVFYLSNLSNKECCVILVYERAVESKLKSFKHTLAHEYAHHMQFTQEGFPYLVPKGAHIVSPSFVNPCEIGPMTGSVYIDSLSFPSLEALIQDSNERVSDVVCEGLLREKKLVYDFLESYKHEMTVQEDPATLPIYRGAPNLKRYVRRLALRDSAEWGAAVQLAYPEKQEAKKTTLRDRKYAIRLNNKYPNASWAHDQILSLCINTDFRSFRIPKNAEDYTKKVMNLLNIRIKTSEKW